MDLPAPRPIGTEDDGSTQAGAEALPALDRLRWEQERRRLLREIELREEALADLSRRLRQAEQEAATTGGELIAVARSQWEQRALAAEAEIAAMRATKLHRATEPLRRAYRLVRRARTLLSRVAARLP